LVFERQAIQSRFSVFLCFCASADGILSYVARFCFDFDSNSLDLIY